MWPLDLSALALGGLVLFLVVNQFGFDDPRLMYNAKTYLIAVPCISLVLALVLRQLTSRFLQKSIQLGFLFSVCVHLLLLIVAVNYVVFSAFLPVASKGEQRERTPIRKTVPEHLFQAREESKETPDWSKPVDAESTSRVIPKEQRRLPPVEQTRPRLEVPKPKQFENQPMEQALMERRETSESQPMPADDPGKLARKSTQQPAPEPSRPVEIPDASQAPSELTQPAEANPSERQIAERPTPAQRPATEASKLAAAESQLAAAAPEMVSPNPMTMAPSASSQSPTNDLPKIGDAGLSRARRAPTLSRPAAIAGSAPAPVTVAVARESSEASRMLSPIEVPTQRSGDTTGAQIANGRAPSYMADSPRPTPTGGTQLSRNALLAAAGAPRVNAGQAARAPGRSKRINTTSGASPVGSINPSEALPANATGGLGDSTASDEVADRLADSQPAERTTDSGSGAPEIAMASPGARPMELDVMADVGPVGLSRVPSQSAGLMPSEMMPKIAALDLPRLARPKRQVGSPATPAGTKIAAVESFSRRVMRTSGGASSSAPGRGGPATEEAIELGLAYLASIQNENGSWSLQGHGDRVLLRSDTAATGLCLLAFQGAGYTHKQHQYAPTVSKGLKFLLDNQRTSGNLYRSENPTSDRNVMFYSHGIAALALCEAYGMTQDPELRPAAQQCLDYIMATQHRKRGGWRYTPQVSSDTSVTGWMMMALKSGDLSGLQVSQDAYDGIDRWLTLSSQQGERLDRYSYNPFAPDTPQQRHGKLATPTMTAVGMLMRMYNGWKRDKPEMRSAAEYLLRSPPQLGDRRRPRRDGYYWYYATQFMFHMGGDYWERWNEYLNPLLLQTQIKTGPEAGSWDPELPVRDRWSAHAGRVYVTTMNLLNLEVYYRHLPIYEETAGEP
ncbi:MAG: hypothetical protein AAFV88_16535 [Planctomycetota bacterium]